MARYSGNGTYHISIKSHGLGDRACIQFPDGSQASHVGDHAAAVAFVQAVIGAEFQRNYTRPCTSRLDHPTNVGDEEE